MPEYLTKRGGFWRFQRRVPDEFASLDRRVIIQLSTKIRVADDPRAVRASEKAKEFNRALETYWHNLVTSDNAKATAEYDAAIRAAKRMNISAPDSSATRTIAELLARIEKLEGGKRIEDRPSVLAVYDLAERPAMTFRQCAEQFIETHQGSWTGKRVAASWRTTLSQYAYPVLGNMPVSQINGNGAGTEAILKVLEPIWSTKNPTASQLRGRLEQIIDWATARDYREGANPARWRGHLDKLLAAKKKEKHHAALAYADVPSFMKRLRAETGTDAQALEFLILSAVRTSEALGARRSEIDRKAKIWTVPAERMKGKVEHRVPLTPAMLRIIDAAPGDVLFPNSRNGKPLTTLRTLFKKMGLQGVITKHGFRSTFRDWAAEQTSHANEVCEAALAHANGGKVEQAYRRGDLFEKRRQLMRDWSAYCGG
jgi:integrase